MSFEIVSQRDGIESRQAADGIGVEIRDVKEIVLKRSITAYENPNDAGSTSGLISFDWNGSTTSKVLTGGKKYICISDAVTRNEIPGNGGERMQVWVHYTPWVATTTWDASA